MCAYNGIGQSAMVGGQIQPGGLQGHMGMKRSVIACNRCRSRKTRCAGNPPFPCVACVNVGHPCVYTDSEKRVTVPESYLHELQERALASSQRNTPTTLSHGGSTPPVGPTDHSVTADDGDDWWYGGTDHFLRNRSGKNHYVGPSSTTHLASRLNPTSYNLAWDVRPLYDNPASLHRSDDPQLPQLPPFALAKRLFWVQYSYLGTIFSLIDPPKFEERLYRVYYGHVDPPYDHNLACCQVLLVIAYGLMYSVNRWSGDGGPPGFSYFQCALRFLPDIHEKASIFFVEVLCYISYYMQSLNRRDAAFLYVGVALRMAISLGLHQEVSDADASEDDRDRRRRAWWSVYSLDRVLSVKSGNLVTIQDEDIGTLWPVPKIDYPEEGWPTIVFVHYTQLSRILGRIGEEIYRKKPSSSTTLIASMQGIMNDLSDWARQLPDRLRLDLSTLEVRINREYVNVFLHFYCCINMTVRPLVFYVVQRRLEAGVHDTCDWKQGVSENLVAAIDTCMSTSRVTIWIMRAAIRQNLVATYGFMDGEHAFSAALLLVIMNAASSYNEDDEKFKNMALNLLQTMADLGNHYLKSRHALLIDLQNSIEQKLRPARQSTGAPSVITCEPIVTAVTTKPPTGSTLGDPPINIHENLSPRGTSTHWDAHWSFSAFENVGFDFDINDDPRLWEKVLASIDINMDSGWIANTLQ